MLVGEPGLGKTRTAQEVETYARMRGAQMLWGRAHESAGAPAYWPWVQVGRGYGAANDLEAAQFRLFAAYPAFIRAAAGRTPLVMTLDDLHWADKPSLLLLQHFARELGRMRVLVLCTYRDTELSRTHPLSEALAALQRESGFQRIVLRGLSRGEVASYIRDAASG